MEGEIVQWSKDIRDIKSNKDLQITTQQNKEWATWTPQAEEKG